MAQIFYWLFIATIDHTHQNLMLNNPQAEVRSDAAVVD